MTLLKKHEYTSLSLFYYYPYTPYKFQKELVLLLYLYSGKLILFYDRAIIEINISFEPGTIQ